jgi:hypothetical protein
MGCSVGVRTDLLVGAWNERHTEQHRTREAHSVAALHLALPSHASYPLLPRLTRCHVSLELLRDDGGDDLTTPATGEMRVMHATTHRQAASGTKESGHGGEREEGGEEV